MSNTSAPNPPCDPEHFAAQLDAAHLAGHLLDARYAPTLNLDLAYQTQRALTRRRLSRGARHIGWKLGYTSPAMRAQMGIDQPNMGPLLDTMLLSAARHSPATGVLLQPRVEPEIAVLIGNRGLVVGARAALEIVDSVWREYKFSLELNTADGSSAAGVLLGPALPLEKLGNLPIRLAHNGMMVAESTSAAAMGHPLVATRWLAENLAQHRQALRPGDIVLTGGLTQAVPLAPTDTIVATFDADIEVPLRGSCLY